MTNSCVLVTGGAGFIGSHLCERLARDGHTVISLDNYFTGSKDNHVSGVEYREGHTRDIARLVPEKPDIVYHLGEYARVAESMSEPAVVWDLNIAGTAAVLEFCRERGAKIVYAGSSTKFAVARTDGTEGRDLSPYTWAKATMTDMVAHYGHWYGMKYAIAYFYNVYGPRERAGKYGTVIQIFKEHYLAGKPLPVRAPGTQERAYTHVLDTVDALVRIGERGEGEGFGISAEESYSLKELASLFTGAEVEMLPARATSRPASEADTTKTKALGWQQEHTLSDYIADIVAHKQRHA